MSRDIQWAVINKTSSFRRVQRNVKQPFSSERLNLKNVHSPRYSGLINQKAVGVEADKSGKGIVLVYKKKGAQNKPRDSLVTVTLKKHDRKTQATVGGFVKGVRPALERVAKKRASQLCRAQRPISAKRLRKINKNKKRTGAA